MSTRNRVVWKEGLFIKPQHFQQQQRNIEYQLNQRIQSVAPYYYGLLDFSINKEYLGFGRVVLDSATGIMPDGTVFNIPVEDILPPPLEIADSALANQIIYLAIPLRSDSICEVALSPEQHAARYFSQHQEIRDIHSHQGDLTQLEVSPVQLKLMFEHENRSAYAALPIARILEKRPDGGILLDPNFVPCHLNIQSINLLQRFLRELVGVMQERVKNIVIRLGKAGQGGVADVTDFMLLQALNRMRAELLHLVNLRALHPERLYAALLVMCSELSSFTRENRIMPELDHYDHDHPTESFNRLFAELRQSLSIVLEPQALSIFLKKHKYGLMTATLHDKALLNDADFILAVSANLPLDELHRLFVQQTKVASIEKIRDLISLQLPGILLSALPVAPRQLPYHAGYIYYRLEKNSPSWAMLKQSGGFAIHVAGDFPELKLQFWAIRG